MSKRNSGGSFTDRPKPWLNPPRPGPTVMVDIDGVIANMDKFADLISAPNYSDRDWKSFHANFKNADLIKPGGKMIRELHTKGFTIAYTTTRLDQFLRPTDRWIRNKSLPPGHIESRSLWIDGSVRPALDVKRRQWWRWQAKYQQKSPIVAWIDDEPAAVAALREQGCPAWLAEDILDQFEDDALISAITAGPEPADVLAARAEAAKPAWDESEAAFQVRHEQWQKRHVQRMKQRAAEERRAR
ncbi:HAD family hydrolase [Prescottella equi]